MVCNFVYEQIMHQQTRIQVKTCPICKSEDHAPWLKSMGFDLVQCKSCGHRWATELFAVETLADDYYNEEEEHFSELNLYTKKIRYQSEYKPMLKKLGLDCGRVLDVGCNAGELLLLFQDDGWDVAGVEISPGPAEHARRILNKPVWQGPAEDVVPKGEQFDLIALTHVLEHIHEPHILINQLQNHLKPGGVILLEVPNASDPLIKIWNGYYRSLCPGDHISFFDEQSVRTLAAKGGFSVSDIIKPVHARDVFFTGLLSSMDWFKSCILRKGQTENHGIISQVRYRGRFRTAIRKFLDRFLNIIDPLAIPIIRLILRTDDGTVIVATLKTTH